MIFFVISKLVLHHTLPIVCDELLRLYFVSSEKKNRDDRAGERDIRKETKFYFKRQWRERFLMYHIIDAHH